MSDAEAGLAPRLAFGSICHRFGPNRETLRGVSLSVLPGEVLCLLGPSGSGKTTLLRIAAGMEPQTSGRVLLDGREIAGPSAFLPPEKRSIGFVFQDFALFPHLSVLENVRFGLNKLPRTDGREAARHALSRVGLAHYAGAYPHVLSGGEQQRVALARALAPRPAVILMDEPFSGLDARLRDSVRSEALDILRQSHATAVVVTHDAEEAMRLGDRIALLKDGCLVQVGRPEELYLRPANLFVAGFFSELNVFHTHVRNGEAQTPAGRMSAAAFADGTAVTVAVRLDGFELGNGSGACVGKILSRRFLGGFELVELAVPGAEMPIRARLRRGDIPADATEVRLQPRDTDTLVFETRAESE